MKLSCLFGVVMCFGVGAMMALPIDDESFETSDTDHYQEVIRIHGVPQNSLTRDTLNTWRVDEDGVADLHLKPDMYKSRKYSHNYKFGHKTAVKERADTTNAMFETISIPETKLPYVVDKPLTYHVEDVSDVVSKNISGITHNHELAHKSAVKEREHTANVIFENISIPETKIQYVVNKPLTYHVEDVPDVFSKNMSAITHNHDFANKTTVKERVDTQNATFENISTNVSETNFPYASGIPMDYHVKDTLDDVSENISVAINTSETNLPYALDKPLVYNKRKTHTPNVIFENSSIPYVVEGPLIYYEYVPDVEFENMRVITNASGANLPYDIELPPEYYVEDTSDDVSEHISIAINPYAVDIPPVYDIGNDLDDDFENVFITNVSEAIRPYSIDIPLEYHVDTVFENVSSNTNDSEASHPYHIDILMEYEQPELAEPSEGGNFSMTTEFSGSENAPSATAMIPNESMVDHAEIDVNCTNCRDIFEDFTEPKLIGCMCALFTTQHPTENDIPLTSRTFHNVSCQHGVSSEDACNKACIGIATINYELMDHMVCSFVPNYIYKLKAFLQSKLCEEDAQWSFTGIASPSPICCYMGFQNKCSIDKKNSFGNPQLVVV